MCGRSTARPNYVNRPRLCVPAKYLARTPLAVPFDLAPGVCRVDWHGFGAWKRTVCALMEGDVWSACVRPPV